MRKLVLTDQAKADLRALDRATRLRIAAAIQRLVLTTTPTGSPGPIAPPTA